MESVFSSATLKYPKKCQQILKAFSLKLDLTAILDQIKRCKNYEQQVLRYEILVVWQQDEDPLGELKIEGLSRARFARLSRLDRWKSELFLQQTRLSGQERGFLSRRNSGW